MWKSGKSRGWETQGQTLLLPEGGAGCCFDGRPRQGDVGGGREIQVGVGVIPGFQRTLSDRGFISQLAAWFPQFQQVGNHTCPGNSETSGCLQPSAVFRKPPVGWDSMGSVS